MIEIHNMIFWVMTPYNLAMSVTNFWTEHNSAFFQNMASYLQHYMMS